MTINYKSMVKLNNDFAEVTKETNYRMYWFIRKGVR